MNFVTMDYFIALAEERSYTKAAARLHITQQTLSCHMQTLEKELGTRLINRTVPLRLTHAGSIFLEHARSFQSHHKALIQEFQDIACDERGHLSLGIASTRGHALLPRCLSIFQKAHTGIDVTICEEENEVLCDLVKAGRLDMIVAVVPPDQPGLVIHKLYSERLVLVVSKNLLKNTYPDYKARVREVELRKSLAPLKDLPYLMLWRGDEPGDLSRRLLEAAQITPWERVQSKNSETLFDLALEGLGAMFVTTSMLQVMGTSYGQASASSVLTIDLGDEASTDISVCWKKSSHTWSIIERFAEVLQQETKRISC